MKKQILALSNVSFKGFAQVAAYIADSGLQSNSVIDTILFVNKKMLDHCISLALSTKSLCLCERY